jgi:hypothetical protein
MLAVRVGGGKRDPFSVCIIRRRRTIMRKSKTLILITLLAALGCGGSATPPADYVTAEATHDSMPADDVHANAMGAAVEDGMHQGGGINAEITLDPEIADDWRAIRVRVVELSSMEESFHDVVIGEEAPLGETGLTLRAVAFIPDFVMSLGGITSRSAEQQNPAARVVIIEQGKDNYEGWLFGAMPEIHAYPHELYGVMLSEGVPAE